MCSTVDASSSSASLTAMMNEEIKSVSIQRTLTLKKLRQNKQDRRQEDDDVIVIPLASFLPGARDVICGRASVQHRGNHWCRQLVADEIQAYQTKRHIDHASLLTPRDKLQIACGVVAQVRKASPMGGFVKRDTKLRRWVQVKDKMARRKVIEIMQSVFMEQRSMHPVMISEASSVSLQAQKAKQGGESQDMTMMGSFLEQYVSKQQNGSLLKGDMEDTKCRPPMPMLPLRFVLADDMTTNGSRNPPRRKFRRIRSRVGGGRYSTNSQAPPGNSAMRPCSTIAVDDEDDSTFCNFLSHLAATIPDSTVHTEDPFEPSPFFSSPF